MNQNNQQAIYTYEKSLGNQFLSFEEIAQTSGLNLHSLYAAACFASK
jgi:hypothetical protein